MHTAYTAIFTRLGLKFRSVVADPGAIGGSGSEEFHVLADSGEDAIAFSDGDNYAANIEMAVALAARHAARRAERGARRSGDSRREDHRSSSRSCSNYPRRSWSRPCWSMAPTAAWSRCWCAATTS